MAAGDRISQGIDLDRGVTSRAHPDTTRVYMYKDLPGVYMEHSGTEIPVKRAREAGFDVKAGLARRLKNEHRAKFEAAIDKISVADSDDFIARTQNMSLEELVSYVESDTAGAKVVAARPEIIEDEEPGEGIINYRSATSNLPRGTAMHEMKHVGGPLWNVHDRVNDEIVIERVTAQVAVDWMIRQARELQAENAA